MNLFHIIMLILFTTATSTLGFSMELFEIRPLTRYLSLSLWLAPPALLLGLMLLYVWRRLRRVSLEHEPKVDDVWAELVGDPQFHPEKGIYATALVGSEQVKILLQPKWWPYFSSTLVRNEKEAVCDGSLTSAIKPGKEPGCLVVIQDERGMTRGMGSRAKLGNQDVLLTSLHVAKSTSGPLYICKYNANEQTGVRVLIEPSWLVDFYCKDRQVDVISVLVPAKVWSALGVKSAPVKVPSSNKVPVNLYGADSSDRIKASTGMAFFDKGFTGRHNATTAKSWSGSPVMAGGFIIGVHRGADLDLENFNKFSIMHPIYYPLDVESPFDTGHVREIDLEEIPSRGYEFEDLVIHGRGRLKYAEAEFAMMKSDSGGNKKQFSLYSPKGRDWAAVLSDDDDDDFYKTDDLSGWKKSHGLESLNDSDIPLNSQGAETELSPPLPTSDSTSSQKLPLSSQLQEECFSLTLEARLSNLEKLLEPLLTNMSLLQGSVSENSKILIGLSADRERSSTPYYSKQGDSNEPIPPPTSKNQPRASSKNIPEPLKGPVFGESGTQTPLKPKSKRLRKRKSNRTPRQESPLRA